MKAAHLIFILMFLPLIMLAQKKYTQRLITSSNGVTNASADTIKIKSMEFAFFVDTIVIKFEDGKKVKMPEGKVWGYEDAGTIYRGFEKEFYQVKQIGSLIIYSRNHTGDKGIVTTDYYFSKGLDDRIFILTWKNISQQFKDNECFLSRLGKEIKWYQDYTNWDRESHEYKFVKVYDECRK